ncbi:MAG TPA: type IV secretory system conjugative DNA transfer family protein [Candidatus Obscuribacterales bacterium]
MPEVAQEIELKLPDEAVPLVMKSVLQLFEFRIGSSDLGILTANRQETGQIFRARKNVHYQVVVQWEPQEAPQNENTADVSDESSWPNLKLSIKVSEKHNTWTQGKCAEHLRNIVEKLPSQVSTFKRKLLDLAKDNRHGSAAWATFGELQQRHYLTQKIEAENFLVGQYAHEGTNFFVSVPKRDTERHALVCGPTGCGKTQSIFVPNLIERLDASAIVTEATPAGQMPDLLRLTAAHRKKHGHQIFYFNPADPRSHCLNPIDSVVTVSDAQDLADIIIRNTTTNKHVGDQVWETSERQLLTALIMKAATEKGNLADVRAALTKGRKELKTTIENAPASKGRDEALALFALSTEGFLNGVMVGLLVRLGPWLNPTVIALTSKTTIDLKTLENDLFTYYLCVPSGARTLKPVAALILNFLLDGVLDQLRQSQTLKRPLMMLLDELTNFGYIPDLPTQLTIMRHAHVPMVLGMQDVEQLKNVYGQSDAKIIFSQPATRIFFKPNEIQTAREISNQLGQGTRVDLAKMSVYPRKLLAPEEVMTLDENRAVCFLPSGSPIQVTKIKPGSYESAAGTPPLPEAVEVDESLTGKLQPDPDMISNAKKEFPKLLTEPATDHEQSELLAKQNDELKRNFGDFKRQRAQKIADYERKKAENERKHGED